MKKALTDSEFSIESGEFSWADQGLSEAHDYIVPVVSAWLKEAKVKTVLDIGCGNGSLTNELTAAGKAQLSREQDRWSQLVDAIGRVMNPVPAGKE